MLWSYGYCVYKVIVCHWDDVASFIIPGCMVMVILYSCSGVRDIPWSRVRVMVLTYSGVIVMVITGSFSVAGMMLQVA